MLARIACQECHREFLVGEGFNLRDPLWRGGTVDKVLREYHYGDPPPHNRSDWRCAGETENCVDLELVEVWAFRNLVWQRYPDREGALRDFADGDSP